MRLSKSELKEQLQELGLKVEGNYIRKKALKEVLAYQAWKPIETYPMPDKEVDYDKPKTLLYSKEDGIVIGRCVLFDKEDNIYAFHYDRDALEIEPTHWMPLPEKP